MPEKRILLRAHLGVDFTKLDNYLKHGGFAMWKKVLELAPDSQYAATVRQHLGALLDTTAATSASTGN